jgi:non-specific serine/threonine protein kinase
LLRRYRLAAGLTQEALAERAGLSVPGLSALESGKRQAPYRHTVAALVTALGLTSSEAAALQAAVVRVRPQASTAPAPRGEDAAPDGTALTLLPEPPAARSNLPVQPTSFIGREREQAEVAALLGRAPLVTLMGAGGCGKTRLALAVAAMVLEDYPDGVRLVELAALADPTLVPQAVVQALGLREQPGCTPLEMLTSSLKHRGVLLVVDNCEHLVGACAELATALLRSCPQLRLLATSREALEVAGEALYRVPSLSMPDLDQLPPLDRLARYEAVQLFLERAQARRADFALSSRNAGAVAQVCAQLDGIPLAIELAAARVASLPVEAIAARLDDRFRLLTGGPRTALPRQRTLRATLDWSWDLLDAQEQILLRRLSVFVGGCTLGAAEAVGSGDGVAEAEVLDRLAALVGKSLVHAAADGEPRYRLLETVRQYGTERLAEAGELEEMRQRHAAYYLTLGLEAMPHLYRAEQIAWMDRLDLELDNLRGALAWCVERGQAGEQEATRRGLMVAGRIIHFYQRGHIHEGQAWLTRLFVLPGATARTLERAVGLRAAGLLAALVGDSAGGQALAEEDVAICKELGDHWETAFALFALGIVRSIWPRPGTADVAYRCANLQEARTLLEGAADRYGINETLIGATLAYLGLGSLASGDLEKAQAELTQGLVRLQGTGERYFAQVALRRLAELARARGDLAGARRFLAQALSLAEAMLDNYGSVLTLIVLGDMAVAARDPGTAHGYYVRAISALGNADFNYSSAQAVAALAALALEVGEPRRALCLVSATLALSGAMGVTPVPAVRARLQQVRADAEQGLHPEDREAAWAEGQAMTLEQLVAEAQADGQVGAT